MVVIILLVAVVFGCIVSVLTLNMQGRAFLYYLFLVVFSGGVVVIFSINPTNTVGVPVCSCLFSSR